MSGKNLRNKLDRFAGLVGSSQSKPAKSNLPPRYSKMASTFGGEVVQHSAGTYCLITTRYRRDYRHGSCEFDSLKSPTLPMSAFTALDEQGSLSIANMIFIDTETTGLGGAGAVPFLVGCASLKGNSLEVRQYLLPDYADEAAMLEDLQQEFSPEAVLVSYNGAAFDLPLLRDRMIINRVARDIEHKHHVDLLHATRRLFRRRLQDCTLGNVEANLFGFQRVDDIPGYLIPSVYFEWLSSESLDFMPQVLEHNRLDIISLYCLIHLVADVHLSEGDVLDEVDDLHSLSRVFGRRKQTDRVGEVFEKIDSIAAERLSDDILLYHSLNFKRSGDVDRAVRMWQQLSRSSSRESYWANLELAKHFEHREKDHQKALKYALKAEKICPYSKAHQKQLRLRVRRLENRLKP